MILTFMVRRQLLQSKCLIWHGEKNPHASPRLSCTTGAVAVSAGGLQWGLRECEARAQDAMHPAKPLPHTHHWHEVFGDNMQGIQQKHTQKPTGSSVLLVAIPKYHAMSEQLKVCGYRCWDSLRMATTLQKIQWSVRLLFHNKRVLSKKREKQVMKTFLCPSTLWVGRQPALQS